MSPWPCGGKHPGNSLETVGIFLGGWKLMDILVVVCALSFETTASLHGKLPFFPQKMPVPNYKSWELVQDFFSRRWKIMGFVQSGSDIVTSSHDLQQLEPMEEPRFLFVRCCQARWWFQCFFLFTPTSRGDAIWSIWLNMFVQMGLNPPTWKVY